jgi:hypothetical protein
MEYDSDEATWEGAFLTGAILAQLPRIIRPGIVIEINGMPLLVADWEDYSSGPFCARDGIGVVWLAPAECVDLSA